MKELFTNIEKYAGITLLFAVMLAAVVVVIVSVARDLLANIGNIARFIGSIAKWLGICVLVCLGPTIVIFGLIYAMCGLSLLIACPPLLLLLFLFKD